MNPFVYKGTFLYHQAFHGEVYSCFLFIATILTISIFIKILCSDYLHYSHIAYCYMICLSSLHSFKLLVNAVLLQPYWLFLWMLFDLFIHYSHTDCVCVCVNVASFSMFTMYSRIDGWWMLLPLLVFTTVILTVCGYCFDIYLRDCRIVCVWFVDLLHNFFIFN